MKIELFHAPGCTRCASSQERLKAIAQGAVGEVDWREVDVLADLDYAVEVGVLSLPSIAIDGKLAFSSLPTSRQWRNALIRCAKKKE